MKSELNFDGITAIDNLSSFQKIYRKIWFEVFLIEKIALKDRRFLQYFFSERTNLQTTMWDFCDLLDAENLQEYR